MQKKPESDVLYTESELYDQIKTLQEERSNFLSYIDTLEKTLRMYRADDRNECLNTLIRELNRHKVDLADARKKIDQLANDLADSERDYESLEKRLERAYSVIDQAGRVFPVMAKPKNQEKS